ncbi:MAG: helix-turn-helix domain-containing protein [Paenibacillaceae bacterium]|nr:helix-turn-helix domain-containing protein [Paenibacillaceae bacterium]
MLLQLFRPHPRLGAYVDSLLLQEDFASVNFANRQPVKVLPSALAVIGIQYGSPMKSIGPRHTELLGTSGISGLQSTFREYVATGGIGTIIVRFKPGGLAAFTPYAADEFQDANVGLELLFPPRLVADMEERLREAATAAERIDIVCGFLLALLREPRDADAWLPDAAEHIQRHRGLVSIERLARHYYVSRRTLERRFNAIIGHTPKKFAGIARFQHAIELKKSGSGYLDIVEACGFADQAHFVHEFRTFAGSSPEAFFRQARQPELAATFNEAAAADKGVSQTMYQ